MLDLEMVKAIYSVARELITLLVYLLASIAAILAICRLGAIADVLKAFGENRGQILELRNTARNLSETVAQLKRLDFSEAFGTLQTQLAKMQRTALDDRATQQMSTMALDAPQRNDWGEIQKIWSDVRDVLEEIIKRDRHQLYTYGEMTRYDYSGIIDHLREDRLINVVIAEDAKHMNDLYLSFRDHPRAITKEVKAEFAQRKARFDAELKRYVPPKPEDAPSEAG